MRSWLCAAGLLGALSASAPVDAKATYITFAPSGADRTFARSINSSGTIAGSYEDSIGSHGYFRTAGGTITTFDAGSSPGTQASSINDSGTITGIYYDDSGQH